MIENLPIACVPAINQRLYRANIVCMSSAFFETGIRLTIGVIDVGIDLENEQPTVVGFHYRLELAMSREQVPTMGV